MKRTVLITGATRGLGRAIAVSFAKAGYQVALNYAHNEDNAREALEEVQQHGAAQTFKADVLTQDGVKGLIADVTEAFGSPDTVVINATPPQYEKSIADYTQSDFDSMAAAFMMSPHYLTQAVAPAMKENHFGRIIHSSAKELAADGITINGVAPGWIPVERHESESQENKDSYLATIPVGRWGTREDIAHAVLFFADQDSGFLTGQSLEVNGGRNVKG